jgi:hypothetical protein
VCSVELSQREERWWDIVASGGSVLVMNVIVVEPCFDSSMTAGADSGDALLCRLCCVKCRLVSSAGRGSVSPKLLVKAVVE